MGHAGEKIVVDVRESDRGSIIYKDSAGKEATYYPTMTTWFTVEDLETFVMLGEPAEGTTEPTIVRRLRGTARLEDDSLSVLGDPNTCTKTLTMSFEANEWRPKVKEDGNDEGLVTIHSGKLGGASLSFNRADWEVGNTDEWWASCYLPKNFVDELEAAILKRQLTGVRVAMALRGLYSNEGPWAPVSERADLFIRPNRADNTLQYPDVADGFITWINFGTTKADLRQPEPEPVAVAVEEPEHRPPPVDPVAAAVTALGANVEKLRGTMKWTGGFIAVCLLFLLMK